jgi:hypothetical protein
MGIVDINNQPSVITITAERAGRYHRAVLTQLYRDGRNSDLVSIMIFTHQTLEGAGDPRTQFENYYSEVTVSEARFFSADINDEGRITYPSKLPPKVLRDALGSQIDAPSLKALRSKV